MAVRRGRGRELTWREARVGAVIVVALILLAYGVFRVGELFDVFAARYPLVALFPTAAGLLEGSAVTVAGQRVGQVERIEFIPVGEKEEGNHVAIHLAVARRVQDQIRADSWARLRTQGLLGDRFVDVEPGSAEAPVLQPGDTVPSIPPVEVEEVLATAAATLDEARVVVQDLHRITTSLVRGEGTLGRLLTDDELYIRATASAAQLEEMLADITEADGTLARLIRDPALYEEIRGAIARIDTVGLTILHGEGTLTRLLRDETLYRQLTGVVGRADTAIVGLGGIVGRLTAPGGTIGRLLADPALYDQLLKAVIDLQILINDIRANPRRYRPEVNVDIF